MVFLKCVHEIINAGSDKVVEVSCCLLVLVDDVRRHRNLHLLAVHNLVVLVVLVQIFGGLDHVA